MRADRQTDRHADHNTSHPSGGGKQRQKSEGMIDGDSGWDDGSWWADLYETKLTTLHHPTKNNAHVLNKNKRNSSRVVIDLYKPPKIQILSILNVKFKTELHSSTLLSNSFHSFIILCEKNYFHNTDENLNLYNFSVNLLVVDIPKTFQNLECIK